jgi:hypothetical protein
LGVGVREDQCSRPVKENLTGAHLNKIYLAWWKIPVIPARPEAISRRITGIWETFCKKKKNKQFKNFGMAQVVEHLLCKHNTLSSKS